MYYIKDAAGKVYEFDGGTLPLETTDPYDSAQFFWGTGADWVDMETGQSGVLFDFDTKEIINVPSAPGPVEIRDFLQNLMSAFDFFYLLKSNPKAVNYTFVKFGTGFFGSVTTEPRYFNSMHNYFGLSGYARAFKSAYNQLMLCSKSTSTFNSVLSIAPYQSIINDWERMMWDFGAQIGNTLSAINRDTTATVGWGLFSHPGGGNSMPRLVPDENDLLVKCVQEICNNYDNYRPYFEEIAQIFARIRSHFDLLDQALSFFMGTAGSQGADPHPLPSINDWITDVSEEVSDKFYLPPPSPAAPNAITSRSLHYDTWPTNETETRRLKFVPFWPSPSDIPALGTSDPEEFFKDIMKTAGETFKSTQADPAELLANLQSIIDCVDPTTTHGFNSAPFPKTMTFGHIIKYIETMHEGVSNKKRFKDSERMHIFGVNSGMDVIPWDDYNSIWSKHVDPSKSQAAVKKAILSASTKEELVQATMDSLVTSILCSLKMHMIHFAAAFEPSEFAKITSFLTDINSEGYARFKEVLMRTMDEVFDVNGSSVDHFVEKVMNFDSEEAWYSSLLSLVYGAEHYSFQNTNGLKLGMCSSNVLKASSRYFYEEEPLMNIALELAVFRYGLGANINFDDYPHIHEEIQDRMWKSISTKGFKYSSHDGGLNFSIYKGKVMDISESDDGGVSMDYDEDGNQVIKVYNSWGGSVETFPLFDQETGKINTSAKRLARRTFSDGLGFDQYTGEMIVDDVFAYQGSDNIELGVTVTKTQDENPPVQVHGLSKKAFTGTLSSILETASFGEYYNGGGDYYIVDDDVEQGNVIIDDIDYAEQAGNLEPGEVN